MRNRNIARPFLEGIIVAAESHTGPFSSPLPGCPPGTRALQGRRGPRARAGTAREPARDRGDLTHAFEREIHDAMVNMPGGLHRRVSGRADTAAGNRNRPVIAFVAIAVACHDIDGIGAIGILCCCALRIRGVYRGPSHENGSEKACISPLNHQMVFLVTLWLH